MAADPPSSQACASGQTHVRRRIHCDPRDTHGRYLPCHEHSYPERQKNGNGRSSVTPPAAPRKDFPATGTPDSVLHADETAVDIERSEQVVETGHAAPESDEWVEPEQDNWLDRDAVRS